MPTIDPQASALNAIVASLSASLGASVTVIRGWPESNVALDLTIPTVSVTPDSGRREACAPRVVDEVTVGDVTTHYYRVGYLRFTAQIDLWCAYRPVLDTTGPLIETALVQAPPLPPELWLTQGSYYSRPITCTLGDGSPDQDGDAANKAEWRKTWDLEVLTDLIRTTTHAKQAEIDLSTLVGDDVVVATGSTAASGGVAETSVAFEP